MSKIPFSGRVVVLGCGGVSQCVLPLILKQIEMPRDRITILDFVDNRHRVLDALQAGVKYVQEKVTRENYAEVFGRFLSSGDLLIDLAWNLGCIDLLEWCHAHDVRYINTSVELWDPYDPSLKLTTDRTLYVRQMALREMVAKRSNKLGATAVVDHGANPGLVSHFTKIGLEDIAKKLIREKPADPRVPQIQQFLSERSYNLLAHILGVKVIHISERDTQITSRPKEVNEFVNTWSVEGFFEEGTAPAEMGWGTHEQALPAGAREHHRGPRNQICLTTFGINTFVRSWVPCGEIVGMVIRHGEAFSISDYLTVWGNDRHAIYRPTVHYAYCPCDSAIASLHELRCRNYEPYSNWRIMEDDIVSGRDELGCLIMGHDFNSWWIGSLLDIEETRRLVPGQNATTLQVAASLLGAIFWIIRNPNRGLNLPDALPHEEIMEIARPYLGPVISQPVDWVPAYKDTIAGHTPHNPASEFDPWQFHNFLLKW